MWKRFITLTGITCLLVPLSIVVIFVATYSIIKNWRSNVIPIRRALQNIIGQQAVRRYHVGSTKIRSTIPTILTKGNNQSSPKNNLPIHRQNNDVKNNPNLLKKKKVELPYDHFQNSPPFPYCEYCYENGIFTARNRGGLQLFDAMDTDQEISYPNIKYSKSPISTDPMRWCKNVVIVQGDSRSPSAYTRASNLKFSSYDYLQVEDQIMGKGMQTIIDATFLINSAYAHLHGYGYLFMIITAYTPMGRSIQWGNVAIMRYVTQTCPGALILYLDSDVYIRSFASKLSVDSIRAFRHSHTQSSKLVGPLGSVEEDPTDFIIAAPVECNWMSWINSRPELRRCFNMQDHNTLFRTQKWPGNAHAGNRPLSFLC